MNQSRSALSFLAAGPEFRVDIGGPFGATPSMNVPLYNGVGDRDFTFIARHLDVSPDEGHRHLGTLEGGDGRHVGLYKRTQDPPLWWLRWELEAGSLWTHLREEDGEAFGATTARAIEIIERDDGLPFVLFGEPMRFAAKAYPGSQEEIMFHSGDGYAIGLSLTRPGFAKRGSVAAVRSDDGDVHQVRVGAALGIDVSCWGKDENTALEVAKATASSLSS